MSSLLYAIILCLRIGKEYEMMKIFTQMNTITIMERIDKLKEKYYAVVTNRYPDSIHAFSQEFKDEVNTMSELELCMRIIANEEELLMQFAKLYGAYVLGDNPRDPIDLITERIDIL
jgi:hypothetical protein